MGAACGTVTDTIPDKRMQTVKHIPFRTSLDIKVEEIEQDNILRAKRQSMQKTIARKLSKPHKSRFNQNNQIEEKQN